MTKKHLILSLAIVLLFFGASFASAEEDSAEPTIEQLLLQIEALSAQIKGLEEQIEELLEQQQALREETLQLTRQLQEGMQGNDVQALQQMLATDPEIYPEGLVTGYFGSMTKRAVQKFQQRAGIDQVGRVGPQTLARINQIFQEGVEGRGVGLVETEEGVFVPPGLLRAPGIQRLMGPSHPGFIPPDKEDNGKDENGEEEENNNNEEE